MKPVLYAGLALLATVLITLYVIEDPGYVLISRKNWSIELSLVLFGLLALLATALLYALVYLVLRIWGVPGYLTKRRQTQELATARQSSVKGLLLLAEGNWKQAQEQLLSSINLSEAPVINYLGAAYACQQSGDIGSRDKYLAQAKEHSPENRLGISYTQSVLQHLAGQHESELETLTSLRKEFPQHAATLKQLLHVYAELKDWPGVIDLAPEARKQKAINIEDIDALEVQANNQLLKLSVPSGSLDVLKHAWQGIPRALKNRPRLVAGYVRQLLEQDETDEAETLLRKAIDNEWNEELVSLYGKTPGPKPDKQLARAQQWLEQHPQDPALLLALALLAQRNGLLDQAVKYADQSNQLRDSAAAWQFKGNILEQQGKAGQALNAYRQALKNI